MRTPIYCNSLGVRVQPGSHTPIGLIRVEDWRQAGEAGGGGGIKLLQLTTTLTDWPRCERRALTYSRRARAPWIYLAGQPIRT